MHIGLDLVGVLVDSVGRWVDLLNRNAGTSYGRHELPDTYGTPELAAFCDAHAVEMLIAPGPVQDAATALHQLKAGGHTLTVITARTPLLRSLTEAWLAYYGMAVDQLHFLEGAGKAPVARAEGVDLMVEDAPQNALALAEAGVPVLLFGAPYNRGVHHPLIHRCEGWTGVLERIASWQYER